MSLVKQIGRNIQGDIWPGLPKKVQSFLFFRIHNPDPFKKLLKAFVPRITTAERACEYKRIIKLEHELADIENRPCDLKSLAGINIAFSSSGLSKLRKYILTEEEEKEVKRERNLSTRFRENQLRGGLFQKGMFADLVGEGWDDKKELSAEYMPRKDKSRPIDGVIMVTSKDEDDLDHQITRVKKHFTPASFSKSTGVTIEFFKERRGKVRPGEHKGKEHFGFADGVSQPIIKDLDERQPMANEPKAVESGMIFVGHGGDEMNQPKWAKDGSFLVFRDFEQLVPEFDSFLEENATQEKFPLLDDSLSAAEKQEKFAAHLMGRWRNGTPVDMNPHNDENPIDETNEDNKFRPNNNFDYHPVNQHRCPFAAHTRKMRPRADLDHDHAVIIRRGIPYGNDVTPEERRAKKSNSKPDDRGLLFTCYQSDIRNGFNFLTTRWASNHHFPDRKAQFVGEHGPGIDAIVGQRLSHHPPRSIGLPDGKDPTEARVDLDSWVLHRGGEYFFSPSIEALDGYLTNDVELALPSSAPAPKAAAGGEGGSEPEAIRARL